MIVSVIVLSLDVSYVCQCSFSKGNLPPPAPLHLTHLQPICCSSPLHPNPISVCASSSHTNLPPILLPIFLLSPPWRKEVMFLVVLVCLSVC